MKLVTGMAIACGRERCASDYHVRLRVPRRLPVTHLGGTPASVDLDMSKPWWRLSRVDAGSNTTLVLPLRWSVADRFRQDLGTSVGLTAVYESTGATGDTTVVVRDQAEVRGRGRSLAPCAAASIMGRRFSTTGYGVVGWDSADKGQPDGGGAGR